MYIRIHAKFWSLNYFNNSINVLQRCDLTRSPYAKSKADEDFVDRTRQKLRELVSSDEYFTKLIYLLALFSPVNMQLPEKENTHFKDYQQKISIMTYSYLMGRYN